MKEQLETLMNEKVRPSLAAHGGGIDIVDYKDGKVFVTLQGGCKGCAGARMTIKAGVERIIKERFPEVTEVVDVTDHDGGATPYR